MNSIMTDYFPVFEMYQAIRAQLMETLADSDLSYTPGGANPRLGLLCREIGEVEQAYIDSFKSFKLDFRTATPHRAWNPALRSSQGGTPISMPS